MTCHLNLELACGDSIQMITYSLKKSSISRDYYGMNKSDDVDSLRFMSAFWDRGFRG